MSQQAMQYRSAVGNGINRRRVDGSWVESHRPDPPNFRSVQTARPVANSSHGGGSSHQSQNHNNSDTANHITSSKHSAEERGDAPSLGGSRSVLDRSLNDRLLFMTACLVGQPVEVQVKNGSIYSGIFHTANAEKDYGVVLKMARLTKDGSMKGGKIELVKDVTKKTPLKTFIIHAKDLVQIIAKDVPLSGEAFPNGRARENHSEILTDAFLSQGRHSELERELKRWMPDGDDSKDLGLESTFQSTWNRNWDQFETNKTLFGVESTFNEELYTTKLDRGPQMRELEREAWRIAREIEGEATRNFHIAEERGVKLAQELEALDEESRFSSVIRTETMDVGEDNEDKNVDTNNDETFGNCSTEFLLGSSDGKPSSPQPESRRSRPPSTDSSQGIGSPYLSSVGRDSPLINSLMSEPTNIQALNLEPGRPQVTEDVYREFNEFKQQENARRGKKQREEQLNELKSFSESLKDLTKDFEPRPQKHNNKVSPTDVGMRTTMHMDSKLNTATISAAQGTLLVTTAACGPSASASSFPAVSISSYTSASDMGKSIVVHTEPFTSSNSSEASKIPPSNHSDWCSYTMVSSVSQLEPRSTTGSLASNSEVTAIQSNSILVSSTPAVSPPSPSSSPEFIVNAVPGKKSTLNPNAKEFKLNPNAKVFTPSVTTVRPPSPVVPAAPLYVPGAVPPLGPMQGMPVGIGVTPLIQQAGQLPKYTQYNSMPMAAGTASAPFLQAPITYAPGVSSGAIPPSLPGPPTIKIPTQAQPPIVGYSFASQQPVRYSSQGPPVQPAPAYIHPNGQLYSQPMMFSQPGQVLYIQQFPQEMIQGATMPTHQQAQASSQQSQQHKHRGGNIQGVQVCIAPPFLAGQQHFIQQAQMSHLHTSLQPSPVLTPTSLPAIQPQGIVTGIIPIAQNTSSLSSGNSMRVGGKNPSSNIQQ